MVNFDEIDEPLGDNECAGNNGSSGVGHLSVGKVGGDDDHDDVCDDGGDDSIHDSAV